MTLRHTATCGYVSFVSWRDSLMEVPPSSETQGTCQKSRTKFLIFLCTHVPTSWWHVKNSGTGHISTFFWGKGETGTPPLGQGFQTAWTITGQNIHWLFIKSGFSVLTFCDPGVCLCQMFPWTNLKSGSSLLTFRDLSSHICQIFMRMARWGDLHFRNISDFLIRIWDFFGPNIWNFVWNGSIWLGRSSY